MGTADERLGQKVRRLRLERGMTQEQLGIAAGYGAGAGVSISRIENGLAYPTDDRLRGLEHALELPRGELAADTEDTLPAKRGRRDRRQIWTQAEQRAASVTQLTDAFVNAADRAHAEYFAPLVDVVAQIDGIELAAAPPAATNPPQSDVAAEALRRLTFARGGVEHVAAAGSSYAAAGAALQLGRQVAYGAYQQLLYAGTASTGAPIPGLHGAARESAAYARLGDLLTGSRTVARGLQADKLLRGTGNAALVAIGLAAVGGQLRRRHNAELDRIEADLRDSQPGFQAYERLLPRATAVLDAVGIHGGRALHKWTSQHQTASWEGLGADARRRLREFNEIAAHQQSIESIDTLALLYLAGEDLQAHAELIDEIVSLAESSVDELI